MTNLTETMFLDIVRAVQILTTVWDCDCEKSGCNPKPIINLLTNGE